MSIGELDQGQVLRGEVRGVTDIKRGELHERADPRRKGGQITSAELSQEGKLLAEKGTRRDDTDIKRGEIGERADS